MKNEKFTIRTRNQLAMHRKRRLLTPKMVAKALGQGSTVQISRYERGETIPPFDVAIKLGIIYGIPMRILFDGYFDKCLNELDEWKETLFVGTKGTDRKSRDDTYEFCSYESKLQENYVTGIEYQKISGHVATLIHSRAKRLDHI